MQTRKPHFLLCFGCMVIAVALGFVMVWTLIPSWGASQEDIDLAMPGDDILPSPHLIWNHNMVIQATPEEIYPWLIQIGDSRGGFYSFTFIQNAFQLAGKMEYRYSNADRIHPEWQNPPEGQGIISDWMVIQAYQPNEYVRAISTPKYFGMLWTWLWYLQPIDQATTRLIVRHRVFVPPDLPKNVMIGVLNAGYVMERSMMLGIRARVEGNVPPAYEELVQIILWLIAFACAVIAVVRFGKPYGRYYSLALGLISAAVVFVLTFVQPPMIVRIVLDAMLIVAVQVVYRWDKAIRSAEN